MATGINPGKCSNSDVAVVWQWGGEEQLEQTDAAVMLLIAVYQSQLLPLYIPRRHIGYREFTPGAVTAHSSAMAAC
jgi:hypothetical protein